MGNSRPQKSAVESSGFGWGAQNPERSVVPDANPQKKCEKPTVPKFAISSLSHFLGLVEYPGLGPLGLPKNLSKLEVASKLVTLGTELAVS